MTDEQLARLREWLRQEREHELSEAHARVRDGSAAAAHYCEGKADAFRSALIALGCAEVGALYLRSERPT